MKDGKAYLAGMKYFDLVSKEQQYTLNYVQQRLDFHSILKRLCVKIGLRAMFIRGRTSPYLRILSGRNQV